MELALISIVESTLEIEKFDEKFCKHVFLLKLLFEAHKSWLFGEIACMYHDGWNWHQLQLIGIDQRYDKSSANINIHESTEVFIIAAGRPSYRSEVSSQHSSGASWCTKI